MKTLRLIVTEKSKFLEKVYAVTDGHTDMLECRQLELINMYMHTKYEDCTPHSYRGK